MEDTRIVELYFARSESAITETSHKYGKYLRSIAYNVLYSDTEAEECENDTYLRAWNTIPPNRPNFLSAFLGKITRNLAITKYRESHAKKRDGGVELVLDELCEIIPDAQTNEDSITDSIAISEAINSFISGLKTEQRRIFVRRYFYMSSIREIADDYYLPISTVKITLHRLRIELKNYLIGKEIQI